MMCNNVVWGLMGNKTSLQPAFREHKLNSIDKSKHSMESYLQINYIIMFLGNKSKHSMESYLQINYIIVFLGNDLNPKADEYGT